VAVADTDRGELDAPVGPSGLERLATLREGPTLGPFATGLGAVVLVALSAAVIGLGTGLETRLGAATLAALIAGLVVLLRPATAVLGVVAVAPVICALKRGLLVPGLRPSEVLVAGVAVPVLLFAGSRVPIRWRLFDAMALLYVVGTFALGAGDMLARRSAFTAELNGQLIGPLQYFLLYRSVVVALDTSELRRQAMRLLLFGSIPVAITALLQFFNVGSARPFIKSVVSSVAASSVRYTDGGLPRATGIMDHWHSLGGYMLVIILLCAGLLLHPRQRVMSRGSLMVVLGFVVLGITLTLTLGPIIGAVVGSIGLGAATGRSRKVMGWLATGALVIVVLLGPFFAARLDQQFESRVGQASGAGGPSFLPQTLRYRVEVWQEQYLPLVADNLLTGYGPGLPPYVNWRYTETLYVTLLLKGGLPLLAIYAGLMYAAWLLCRSVASSSRASPDDRCIARVGLTLILILIPMHLINPYFANTGLAHPLWILFGLVAAAAGQLSKRPPQHRSEGPVDADRSQAHSGLPRPVLT
jgi:O-antigen ligase